jgi:PEP-CTERM motif-containing protein
MTRKHTCSRFSWKLGITSLTLVAVAFGSGNIAYAVTGTPGMPLAGNPDFTFTFDENGHGFFDNNQPVQWGVAGGGGIDYVLPVPVHPGNVLVLNNSDVGPNNPNGFSDLLTFFNITQNNVPVGVLFYQSLQDDNSPPDFADVLNLIQPATTFSVAEIGPEGANGFKWVDPFGLSATTYNGISDVPEPSTIILGGLGLIALLLIGRRRGGLKKV